MGVDRSEGPARLDVIDGLRAVAIFLVFGFHLYGVAYAGVRLPQAKLGPIDFAPILGSSQGFYGVELFFFLSGFCLSYPYVRAYFGERSMPTLAHYAYARAIKIIPSYYLAIAGAIALGYAVFPSAQYAFWQIALHLVFLHTLLEATLHGISSPLWSLGVEIQFYLIFPSMMKALLRAPLRTMLLAASLGWFEREQYAGSWFASHQLPMEIDVFVTGMFAAYLYQWFSTRREALTQPRWSWAWMLLALGGVAVFVACSEAGYAHGGSYNRSLVCYLDIAFLGVTLGSLFGWRWWRRFMGNPVLVFYAKISYNFYLWHLVVRDEFMRHGLPKHGLGFFLANCIGTTLLAALLTYGFERPLMRLRPFAGRSVVS